MIRIPEPFIAMRLVEQRRSDLLLAARKRSGARVASSLSHFVTEVALGHIRRLGGSLKVQRSVRARAEERLPKPMAATATVSDIMKGASDG
jgi:hypothetical protein